MLDHPCLAVGNLVCTTAHLAFIVFLYFIWWLVVICKCACAIHFLIGQCLYFIFCVHNYNIELDFDWLSWCTTYPCFMLKFDVWPNKCIFNETVELWLADCFLHRFFSYDDWILVKLAWCTNYPSPLLQVVVQSNPCIFNAAALLWLADCLPH